MRQFGRKIGIAAALVVGSVVTTAHADDWIEPRDNDAGAFVQLAQIPFEATPGVALDSIQGVLNSASPRGGNTQDPQDIFEIFIPSPTVFRASAEEFGSLDIQLFLFDGAGRGLLANDDRSSQNVLPFLFPASDDGTFVLTTPGLYYLGVAGKGNFPRSGPSGAPIFNYATPTEISGPEGPGVTFPLSSWGGPESLGAYRIALTGVLTAPSPGAASMLVIAGAALGRRRRGR